MSRRVTIRIYDEDSDETIVSTDEPLFQDEEEIARQAFRTQRLANDQLDKDSEEWNDI